MYIAFTCGTGKDTYNNVLATGEFVVNVVPFEQPMLDKVLVCGLPFKANENELGKAGLTPMPALGLRPPRIAECRSHFECKVEWTQHWLNRLMVCGRVNAVSIDADCVTPIGIVFPFCDFPCVLIRPNTLLRHCKNYSGSVRF